MDHTPVFEKPILYSNLPKTNPQHWDDAAFAFDEKNYAEALTATFNYINEDILDGESVYDGMPPVTYPHGSAIVQFRLLKSRFHITSSFLKVPTQHKVPLLRKVAELNFTPLTLSQIVYSKEDGILSFSYDTPIELTQPNKIYELVKEICIFADDFDDEFIKKYGASFYHQPHITPLSPEEHDIVWQQITQYIDNALLHIKQFEEKRLDEYVWDVIVETLLAIVDHTYVNGYLRTSIERKIQSLRDNDETNLERKNAIGKAFLKKLQEMSREEIMKDIFVPKKFLSTKKLGTHKKVSDSLGVQKSTIDTNIENRNYINAFFHLKYAFQLIVYTYNLPPRYWHLIMDSLSNASETSWKIGTEILKETFDQIISGEIEKNTPSKIVKKERKPGFFSRLFN